jgi:hypothetical protein
MSSRGRTSRTLSWPCSSATRRRCPRCTASTPAGASPRARTALERAGFSRGRARHHPGALLRHFAPRAFQADMDDTKLGVGPKEPRDAPARRSQAHSLFSYLPCDCTSTCLPARRSRSGLCKAQDVTRSHLIASAAEQQGACRTRPAALPHVRGGPTQKCPAEWSHTCGGTEAGIPRHACIAAEGRAGSGSRSGGSMLASERTVCIGTTP